MADTEIWERACERIGLWKRGQRCNGFQRPSDNDTKVCVDCGATKLWYGSHTIPVPAIGDPAAVVAMLEWLAAEIDVPTRDDDTGEIVQVPDRRGLPELWFGDDYHWHCRPWGYCETAKHRLLALALASAVLAVPQESQA